MRLSVIVPSFRRPDRLGRALGALTAQLEPVDEIIVAGRADDESISAIVKRFPGVLIATTDKVGVLAAMRAGAEAASGDLLGFVDDDAEPPPHWSATCVPAFADSTVGAVSGRDIVSDPEPSERRSRVGQITAWGRLLGDHHLGEGPRRDVDVLKAANVVFRREALVLPASLRGTGAQAHFEIFSCQIAIRAGWRMIFDPGLEVLHLPGPRHDPDGRRGPTAGAVRDASYNLVVCLLAARPELWGRRAAYGLLVGDRAVPGLLRAALGVIQHDRPVYIRFMPALGGQIEALRDVRRGAVPEPVRFV